MMQMAVYGLIGLSSALVLLHVLVLLKIIPYQNLWGGRLKSDQEMYRFEAFSVAMSLVFVFVYLAAGGWLPFTFPSIVIKVMLWIMTALFVLNTLGNLTAKNNLEKFFFAPLTILMSVLTGYVALSSGD